MGPGDFQKPPDARKRYGRRIASRRSAVLARRRSLSSFRSPRALSPLSTPCRLKTRTSTMVPCTPPRRHAPASCRERRRPFSPKNRASAAFPFRRHRAFALRRILPTRMSPVVETSAAAIDDAGVRRGCFSSFFPRRSECGVILRDQACIRGAITSNSLDMDRRVKIVRPSSILSESRIEIVGEVVSHFQRHEPTSHVRPSASSPSIGRGEPSR